MKINEYTKTMEYLRMFSGHAVYYNIIKLEIYIIYSVTKYLCNGPPLTFMSFIIADSRKLQLSFLNLTNIHNQGRKHVGCRMSCGWHA